jgi:predicted amidohydrolase
MQFKIALLQILANEMDQEHNLNKGIEWSKRAKHLGADLALFPEMWNIGYAMCPADEKGKAEWEAAAINQSSLFFRSFVDLSRSLQLNIAITYLESHQPKPRNTVSIINTRGEIALNYSKVFICNFGMDEWRKEKPDWNEVGCDVNCTPGTSFPVGTLTTSDGMVCVGAMICADREFPEASTQLMLNGAEIIVIPNCCDWHDARRVTLRTRALDNLVGVAMTNYPGLQSGHSSAYHCVCWKDGKYQDNLVVEAGEEEGIYLATFNLHEIRAFREMEKWRLDYKRRFAHQALRA